MDQVIRLADVSKSYKLYNSHKSRLKEALHPFGKKYHRDFFALKNINLEIKRGESVGILGMNGAGKSTLLKAITGVLSPSSGTVDVKGHISALLELGSGFNPEFSGYENVFFYGALMGFTRGQMEEKIDDILEFADIGEFINQPVKTYSSGMKARLAFSVATSIEPDILILDEVLSVGDAFFKAKCTERMHAMINNNNVTVIFVSHDISSVRAICGRCILMEGGKIVEDGATNIVTDLYMKNRIKSRQKIIESQIEEASVKKIKLSDNADFLKLASFGRVQNGKAEVLNVSLLNTGGDIINHVSFNETVTIKIELQAHVDLNKLNVAYSIKDNKGLNIIHNSLVLNKNVITDVKLGDCYTIRVKTKMPLAAGNYSVQVNINVPSGESGLPAEVCDKIPIACQFTVEKSNNPLPGYVYLENETSIKRIV